MVIVGIFDAWPTIDINRLILKELRLLGSIGFAMSARESEYVTAARKTGEWESELRMFATHQLPVNEADRAFETAADKSSGAIKVTLMH
jgi:threonine dehydrogenase-like Zn-dependent dehydrogenase